MDRERLWRGGAWEYPHEPVRPLVLPETKRKKKRRSRRTEPAIFMLFLLLIGVFTAVAVILARTDWADYLSDMFPGAPEKGYEEPFRPSVPRGDEQAETQIPRVPAGGETRLELQPLGEQVLTVQEIYGLCSPCVVYIQAQHESGTGSSGSGVILSADGYILTNAHIIAGASCAQVVFQDNTVLEAGLVGWQEDYDLAVLKVQADGLTPARFGSSADLRVGATMVAIGNPLGGTLRGTMTQGIVSAIDRSVNVDGTTMSLLQTTAALNPGNSGGALINDRGQVVGITTMKMMSRYETIEGLGFAIPTRLAKRVVDQIIATGRAGMPALGITVMFDRVQFGGLKVTKVHENSDAWAKGLREGDVIVAVNGVPLTDDDILVTMKEELGIGGRLNVTVAREDETLEFEIELMDAQLFE